MDDIDRLLAQSQAGDECTFEELVRTWVDRLHALAWRTTGDRTRAEDVVQEVFLRVASGRAQYRGRGSAAGWLLRATARVALDDLRSETSRSRRERRAGMTRVHRNTENMENDVVDDETRNALRQALDELDPLTRACVWLHAVEELSVREIGFTVGKGHSATSERIRRGLEALRAVLRRRGLAVDAVLIAGALGVSGLTPGTREALVGHVLAAGIAVRAETSDGIAATASSPAASSSLAVKLALAGSVLFGVVCGVGIWLADSDDPVTRADEEATRESRPSTAAASPPAALVSELPAVSARETATESERAEPIAKAEAGSEPEDPATLTVYTVDEAGEPAAEAAVVLRTMVEQGPTRAWGTLGQPVQYHRTDGAGRLVLEDVAPGRYKLLGSRFDRAGSGPPFLDIAKGDQHEVTLVLEARPHVVGRAYLGESGAGASGAVLANADLDVTPPHGRDWEPIVRTDADGGFVVGPVYPGDDSFQLGYEDSRVVTIPLVATGEKPQEVEVVFVAGVTAVGDVRNLAGDFLSDVEVTWHRKDTRNAERLHAVTGDDGRDERRGLEPGVWLARVEALGYHPEVDAFEETVPDVSLHEASFVVDCLPELEILAVDEDGQPIPGLELRFDCRRRSGGFGNHTLFTDAEGRVRLQNVWRDGKMTVEVEDPRYRAEPVTRNVAEMDESLVIRVGLSFQLQGMVIDAGGRPVGGARVAVHYGDEEIRRTIQRTTSDAKGRFAVAIVPDTYRILATAGERGAGEATARIGPDGPDDGDLRVTVDSVNCLRVRVVDPGGEPIGGAEVSFTRVEGGAPRDATLDRELAIAADTDDDGWCVVPVEPGDYEVEANWRGYGWSKLDLGRRLRPGEPPAILELSALPPLVRGVVLHEGSPVPRARVGYWSGSGPNTGGTEGMVSADDRGRFVIKKIRRAEDVDSFVVYAWGPGFAIARSEVVRLVAGETAEVAVRSLPGEDLVVQIVDESGAFVPGAELEIRTPDAPPVNVDHVASATGTIRVPRLPTGRYRYGIRSADHTREGYGDFGWPDDRPLASSAREGEAALVWKIAPRPRG
jgi:RNA polymerase sigma-70 factor (ECF subfamily)